MPEACGLRAKPALVSRVAGFEMPRATKDFPQAIGYVSLCWVSDNVCHGVPPLDLFNLQSVYQDDNKSHVDSIRAPDRLDVSRDWYYNDSLHNGSLPLCDFPTSPRSGDG